MTSFEQTVLKELAALPQSRRSDVLAFIRFLKISLMDEEKLEREYDEPSRTPGQPQKNITLPRMSLTQKFAPCEMANETSEF